MFSSFKILIYFRLCCFSKTNILWVLTFVRGPTKFGKCAPCCIQNRPVLQRDKYYEVNTLGTLSGLSGKSEVRELGSQQVVVGLRERFLCKIRGVETFDLNRCRNCVPLRPMAQPLGTLVWA